MEFKFGPLLNRRDGEHSIPPGVLKVMLQELVRPLLANADQRLWSAQGLGMMRTYLSKELRLHVWDSSLRVPNASPIHDHPWDFESYVVAGLLRQHRYNIVLQGPVMAGNAGAFNMTTIKCGAGAVTLSPREPVILSCLPVEIYKAGDAYKQRAEEIHCTLPEDGTVTLVWRKFRENTENARVFWKGAHDFVSAEPRAATPAEVERVAARALRIQFDREEKNGNA